MKTSVSFVVDKLEEDDTHSHSHRNRSPAARGTGVNVGVRWASGPGGMSLQNKARVAARLLSTEELRAAAGPVGGAFSEIDAAAMCELGERLLDGVPKEFLTSDPKEAVSYFRTASDANYSYATFCLATCYFTGKGVPKDDGQKYKTSAIYISNSNEVEGARLATVAAEASLVEAMFCLGGCYERGCGIRQSYENAIKWFRRAASFGDDEARDGIKRCNALMEQESANTFGRGGQAAALGEENDDDDKSVTSNISELNITSQAVQLPPAFLQEKWYNAMVGDLKRAADAGDIYAQHAYSLRLIEGMHGVKQDVERAVYYWKRACANGYVVAQVEYGERLFRGNGVEGDFHQGLALLSRAAQQGEIRALYLLGIALEHGECVPVPPETKKKKPQGGQLAKLRATKEFEDDPPPVAYGPERDVNAAIACYRMAAELGHESARIAWRRMERAQRANIWEVRGLEAQKKAKEEWRTCESFASLKLNSDDGNAPAQFEMASRLREKSKGKPVSESLMVLKQASVLYKYAAEQGYAFAQEALGNLYYDGATVPRNFRVATRFFRQAADQGLASAQHSLADCYESGEGFENAGGPDLDSAVRYYKLAAAQGDPLSISALARIDRDHKLRTIGPSQYTIRVSAERAEMLSFLQQKREMIKAPLGQGMPAITDASDDALVSAVWPAIASGVAAPFRAIEGDLGAYTPSPAVETYRRPNFFHA
jgi:TPR repeat protein